MVVSFSLQLVIANGQCDIASYAHRQPSRERFCEEKLTLRVSRPDRRTVRSPDPAKGKRAIEARFRRFP